MVIPHSICQKLFFISHLLSFFYFNVSTKPNKFSNITQIFIYNLLLHTLVCRGTNETLFSNTCDSVERESGLILKGVKSENDWPCCVSLQNETWSLLALKAVFIVWNTW